MDKLRNNTNLLIATPRDPTDKKLLKKISSVLSDIEQVREAHLPEVLEIGAQATAALTLFVVIEPASDLESVTDQIKRRLAREFGRNTYPDVRAVTSTFALLKTIREANCVVGWRD